MISKLKLEEDEMMKLQSNANKVSKVSEQYGNVNFHGAALVDENGEEIPITETMVQRACKNYIKQWESAQKKTAKL